MIKQKLYCEVNDEAFIFFGMDENMWLISTMNGGQSLDCTRKKQSGMNELVLINGIRNGESQALEQLYKLAYPPVAHFVLTNNGSEEELHDIYQEGIIIVYEKLKTQTFQLQCALKTYLYSVCRHLWLQKLYKKKKFVGKPEDFEQFVSIEAEEVVDDKEVQFSQMESAMNTLGEPCRTLLEDFYVRSLNMQEITEKFGYNNYDTAKNQKYKCLVRLKKIFFRTE